MESMTVGKSGEVGLGEDVSLIAYGIAVEVKAAGERWASEWLEQFPASTVEQARFELVDDRSHGDDYVAAAAQAVAAEWKNERDVRGYVGEVCARADVDRAIEEGGGVLIRGQESEREATRGEMELARTLLVKWTRDQVKQERWAELGQRAKRLVKSLKGEGMTKDRVGRVEVRELSVAPELVAALEKSYPVEHPEKYPEGAKFLYVSYLQVDRSTGTMSCGVAEAGPGPGPVPEGTLRFWLPSYVTGEALRGLVESEEFRARLSDACRAEKVELRGARQDVTDVMNKQFAGLHAAMSERADREREHEGSRAVSAPARGDMRGRGRQREEDRER